MKEGIAMNRARLRKQLRIDEGEREFPYKDSVGKLTIGVGRNLDDRGLRPDEIALMLENDIDEAEGIARSLVKGYEALDDVRKEVLVNMALNLGKTRLSGFKRFFAALSVHDYAAATAEMQDSKWYEQVGARGRRLAYAMREGRFQ